MGIAQEAEDGTFNVGQLALIYLFYKLARSETGLELYRVERLPMNLTIWLPALFFLGLATLGLMFLFLAGCDRV